MNPYLLAVGANLSFALGSMFFTHYATRFSSLWMNTFKGTVAACCFCLAILATSGFHQIEILTFGVFFISGFIALGVGDIFLVKAFTDLGPARTMVLFGFHPVIVGFLSFIFFDQAVSTGKLIGILFFITCLIIFSVEKFRASKKWEFAGILIAMAGMSIDAVGVAITRYAFNLNENITAFEGNFYRCLGAIVALALIGVFRPFQFFEKFKSLQIRSRFFVILGSFFGTFLSLALYLQAIKTAHLASISAISITSVLFASIFESIFHKKLPSKYLIISFGFFVGGMYFVVTG